MFTRKRMGSWALWGAEFEVIRPLAPEPKAPEDVDESTDNYDTIEWLLENIPNHNGRVGQWGISYPGWQAIDGDGRRPPGAQSVVSAGFSVGHVHRR